MFFSPLAWLAWDVNDSGARPADRSTIVSFYIHVFCIDVDQLFIPQVESIDDTTLCKLSIICIYSFLTSSFIILLQVVPPSLTLMCDVFHGSRIGFSLLGNKNTKQADSWGDKSSNLAHDFIKYKRGPKGGWTPTPRSGDTSKKIEKVNK